MFDLLTERWFHVTDPTLAPRTVGLREALLDAERITAVVDPDSGAEAALHRLLLAIYQAAVYADTPRLEDDEIPTEWPAAVIQEYLDAHTSAFDLAHPTRPFLQSHYARDTAPAKTPGLLGAPFLAGEGRIMAPGFPRHNDAMDSARAARLLLAVQQWGNGQKANGVNPHTGSASTPAGVLAGALVTIPKGATLAQTLMMNFTPVPPAQRGIPVWETPDEATPPSGWLGRLVWPSRGYALDFADDHRHVTATYFAVGWRAPELEVISEPMFTYNKDKPDGSPGTYLRGPSAPTDFYRNVPTIYGYDGARCQAITTAQRWLEDAGLESEHELTLYGRNNIGQKVAGLQTRVMLPATAGLIGSGPAHRLAVNLLNDAVEATAKVSSTFGRAVGPEGDDDSSVKLRRATSERIKAAASDLYFDLLQTLARPETMNAAGADAVWDTYIRALTCLLRERFEALTRTWTAQDHAQRRRVLETGIAKHLPLTPTTEEIFDDDR
ncbi:type I-E CRISPR-associated protein Cse1/CasA [uncultured Kocuria sp.]|uniref:type I-E CRISPR-associated protein Cse1/CasA n=1 Tax=uncultured Kocuria sp. TaxID=259305 RepID=UPI0026030596|nr:type I-E CRISPR-associated protein Cse1/CasA [uncultured Kocuria sp.]